MTLGRNFSRKQYLAAIAVVWLGFAFAGPAITQDPSYHAFAGENRMWHVSTNLPFVAVGLWGLWRARDAATRLLSTGLVLTGFGSAYYHAAPDDPRLVWDRLPMTLVFMPALARTVEVWIDPSWGRRALWPLAACGLASVTWWSYSGDLRAYAVVQFGPALVLVPAAVTDRRVRGLWRAGAAYTLAKLAEGFDAPIHAAIGIPGHALKHLLAALAAYWVVEWSSTCFGTAPPSATPPADATRTAP